MDERTRRYYEDHAEEAARQQLSIASPIAKYLGVSFPRGTRVLDLGTGAGRDLAEMIREGYDAYGVEPSEALRNIALVRDPTLRGRVFSGSLPGNLGAIANEPGQYGGIVCVAVLQHLPRSSLFDAAFQIRGLLKPRGRLLITIPEERGDVQGERGPGDRLYNGLTPDELELLLERVGFASLGSWQESDELGRRDVKWRIMLFEQRATGPARQIDLIETVLSTRERKVATYKLALIRALCAIALTEPHVARFGTNGMVRVPVRSIAERWIDYYWPLFASATFLPQMNGERKSARHLLAFSKELTELIEFYRRRGQLTGFAVERRSAEFSGEAARLHSALISKLQRTIVAGPVTYASGSQPGEMFGHHGEHVLVRAPLWRELALMGHWIQDALILRWAELVERLSDGEATVDKVVACLLVAPGADREQSAAREVYAKSAGLECVWTGRSLRAPKFDVDHAIPFSLWHNNDLWNLLPASEAVNKDKSDKIPETVLLRSRRDAIVHCWELTRAALPRRFEHEAMAQIGVLPGEHRDTGSVDLALLFERLVESAEVTALQRACLRWQPTG